MPGFSEGLLFAGSGARLGDDFLKQPADGWQDEDQESECQCEVDDDAAEEGFGTHVGAQVELGAVELSSMIGEQVGYL